MLVSRRGEVYWAIFRWTGMGDSIVLSVNRLAPRALAQSLTEPTLVFGAGWSSMESEIRAALPVSVTVTVGPHDVFKPSAIHVARIGLERLRCGEIAGDLVMPLYVQRTEAEINTNGLEVCHLLRDVGSGLKPSAARLARGRRRSDRQDM